MKAVSSKSLFKSNKTWLSRIKWIFLLPIWIIVIIIIIITKIMIMITIIEQTKFTLSPLGKAFEKQIKQLNINEKDK